MIRLLVISYHFPPLNVISSYRPEGYAKYLPQHGIHPTIVTMDWGDTPTPKLVGPPCSTDGLGNTTVVRAKRTRGWLQRWIDGAMRIPVIAGGMTLLFHMFGQFNTHIIEEHRALARCLRRLLGKEEFDAVVCIVSPDEHLRLGAWCKRRYGLPFIADYRDTYDNRSLMSGHRPGLRHRILLALREHYHKKWTSRADLLASVSAPWTTFLAERLRPAQALEVRNGFDPELIDGSAVPPDRQRFVLLYSGRLFPDQDLRPFLKAATLFVEGLMPEERDLISIEFHGVRDEGQARAVRDGLPSCARTITVHRIPRERILERLCASSILLIFDYGIRGVYSGKLMEYAGADRNILLIPSDHGVMADLITDGRLGLATDEPMEAARFLLARFNEWKADGKARTYSDPDVIRACSQPHNVGLMADAIRKVVLRRRPADP